MFSIYSSYVNPTRYLQVLIWLYRYWVFVRDLIRWDQLLSYSRFQVGYQSLTFLDQVNKFLHEFQWIQNGLKICNESFFEVSLLSHPIYI